MTPLKSALGREVMWRRVMDDLSFEHARLVHADPGHEISGSIFVAQDGAPLRVEYRISCDPSWQTRTVLVDQSWRGVRRRVRLDHDGTGHWRRDGKPDNRLAGCTDVDLSVSPSTNVLPINRLQLPLGNTGEICAAWISFPELGIAPALQSYHHLAERQYEYKSLASGFTALIEVDGDGLPTNYAGVWRRIAEDSAAPWVELRGC